MALNARIHSIETCGTVDGPGIRYILFLAGCPLRCKYCHNCDTWNINSGELMSTDEVLNNVRKYKSYFKFSSGGITVSGGEPTLQWEFVSELFKKCKDEGIHTCIDTSGYCDIEKAEKFLPYTDLVLLDIKHIDDDKHFNLTGVHNKKTLTFAKYLSHQNIPVWIRYVLVPGYSDDLEDIEKLCLFIKTLSNVQKVEILPYHQLGVHKWEELGLEYELSQVEPPTKELIRDVQDVFIRHNICIDTDDPS